MTGIEIGTMVTAIAAVLISIYFGVHTVAVNLIEKSNKHVSELDKLLITYPELYTFFYDNIAAKNMSDIEKDEIYFNRIRGYILLSFNTYENLYIELLSKKWLFLIKDKKAWETSMIEFFEISFVKEMWDKWGNQYNKRFIKFMNKKILQKIDNNPQQK